MKAALVLLLVARVAAAAEIGPAIRDLMTAGRFTEARDRCRQVTARDRSDVEHWVCSARMSAWLGEYAVAAEAYDVALSLLPHHVEALTGKAQVLLWQGEFEPAQALLSQAQATAPASADVELVFAQLERARGRRLEAKRHANRAAKLNPSSADAHSLLRALAESAPVRLRLGVTRDLYSFTVPGVLGSLAVDYEGETGGASLLMEGSNRFGATTTRGGGAYRLRFKKRWTAQGEVLIGSSGIIYPALELKGGISARLNRHWVAGAGYRRLAFDHALVKVVSPSIEYYFKRPVWVQGAWHQSWSVYKQQTQGGRNRMIVTQVGAQVNRRLLARIGYATGDENFINWARGQIGGIQATSAFGGIEYQITQSHAVGFSYGFQQRSNHLKQQTWGLHLVIRP